MSQSITILAIESSCDDTGAAIIKDGVLLSNIVSSQSIHQQYGGVVPELASREHEKNIIPTVHATLLKANISKKELTAIAFCQGPGLLGSLLVGNCFAKSMSQALNIPLIGIDHMSAHILAHFIEDPKPNFPFLCLTISGGHTQIVKVNSSSHMEILGSTIDDAVGEAFDKAAKLLDLPYPGGPLIDQYAQTGNADAYQFPLVSLQGLNYSFSGIKTAFLYFLQENKQKNPDFVKENLNDICASIQKCLVDILFQKLNRAVKETRIIDVAIAGGVSANSLVRKRLSEDGKIKNWNTFIPDFQYCTDNAGMIAMAAHFKYLEGNFEDQYSVPNPRLKFC